MSNEERKELVKKNPAYGRIIAAARQSLRAKFSTQFMLRQVQETLTELSAERERAWVAVRAASAVQR